MPSIRRSLVVYTLALVTAVLGAVALVAERVLSRAAEQTAIVFQDANNLRTENLVREARERFDAALLSHARVAARNASTDYRQTIDQEWLKYNIKLRSPMLGLSLVNPVAAVGYAGTVSPGWGRRQPGPAYGPWAREHFANLRLAELFQRDDDDDRGVEYLQVNGSGASVGRSRNMGDAVLPFDRADRERVDAQEDDWSYDGVLLPGNARGRRVILRTPLPYLASAMARSGPQPPGGPQTPAGPNPRGGRSDSPRAEPPRFTLPRLYIHVARPVADLDQTIADIRAESGQRAAEFAATATRKRMFWLATLGAACGAAFVAVLVGLPLLVRRGLRPLGRMTDAVGQVSEKDFRLPLSGNGMPGELAPIHDRLTGTLDQLKAAFEREKQAVADISHELRTPVAALLATIDVSLRKPRTADQYKQTLQDCRGITKQLGALVERVMTLAYLDAGQVKASAARVAAGELVHECAAVIRPLAEAHGLTFHADADEELDLDTDPGQLREVLMNLLHNAVEYNQPGGSVSLAASRVGGRAVFAVTDTGIGMPADVRAKIFERFYRADPSRTQTGVHAGLGLAIVKEYVDRLGGTITVESEPGAGSTFRVELPAVAAGELAAA